MAGSGRFGAQAALAAAGVCACVAIWHGIDWRPDETTRLRDDAFYEYVFAANVAAGRGPVVSGQVTTSGVQWLWSLLLVPFVEWFGAERLPRIAPWIGLGLHGLAGVIWLFVPRERVAGLCLMMCWWAEPLLLREAQNGQETALAALFATMLWWRRRAAAGWWCVLAAAAVAARSDLWMLVAALSWWREPARLRRAIVAPLVALLPWLVANRLVGGGWLPDSAAPMAWLWHANQHAADPSWSAWAAAQWWFTRPVLLGGPFALAGWVGQAWLAFLLLRPLWPRLLRVLPSVMVGIAAAIGVHDLWVGGLVALLLVWLPAAPRRGCRSGCRPPRWGVALAIGLWSIVLLHWAVRWYPRDYYLAPLVVAGFAAIARHRANRGLLVLLAATLLPWCARLTPEPLGGQRELAMAGRFLAEVLPSGEAVGCFNSGLVTFHAAVLAAPERRRVVRNLDGVVDRLAFDALSERRLDAFLTEQGVRFVLDNPVQFALDPRLPHACGRWFGPDFRPEHDLVEVARFDVPGLDAGRPDADSVRLYWRRGHGRPPGAPGEARVLADDQDGYCHVLWPARAGQTLAAEMPDGRLTALADALVDTAWVLGLRRAELGTGRLFVVGAPHPLLVLP